MSFKEFRESELGKRLRFSEDGGEAFEGIVVDVELTGSNLANIKTRHSKMFPAMRYRLYPTDGERKDKPFWTCTFAYNEERESNHRTQSTPTDTEGEYALSDQDSDYGPKEKAFTWSTMALAEAEAIRDDKPIRIRKELLK